MARLRSDPEMLERMKAAARKTVSDSDFQRHRIACLKRDRTALRRFAKAGTAALRRIYSDPEALARRADAARASVPARVRRNAERLAASVGIPVECVDEFRALRNKHLSKEDAAAVLRRSFPELFVDIIEAEKIERRRAAGPEPAPHMPQRREWLRKMGEVMP